MKILNKTTNQLLLLPKYNKTQVYSLLNVSMVFLFLSLQEPQQILYKSTGYFFNHINKNSYFYSHTLQKTLYISIWHSHHYQHSSIPKNKKGIMQIKRGKCYSLILLCLKINYVNNKTK